MPATLSVSDVLQHETFNDCAVRSRAGPTLVRYDLKEGAVAAGFDVGEKQGCERNAAMATLNQPGPPQEIDKFRFEIAGGDGFGIAEPRSQALTAVGTLSSLFAKLFGKGAPPWA
jgi:hypothetical protein